MAKKLINKSVVLNVVGTLIIITGVLMALAIPFSFYYNDGMQGVFIQSTLITIAIGLLTKYLTRKKKNDEVKKREGYLIVAFGWTGMIICSAIPYLLSGAFDGITNVFFETVSGLTTTGSSILNNIEQMPESILFWRSMTQWIGGMGIIVLTIAILPLLGVGGMELFASEAPGPTKDKIHPRIKETAKRLWLIYVSLTLLQTTLLWVADMSFFDALNHALTTMSTGGFSTKQASIAHFTSPLIQYIIILFMFLAGTNFTLLYFGSKLKFKKFWNNDEFNWYVMAVILLTFVVTPLVYFSLNTGVEESIRTALFQVVSIITTTGYGSANYTEWGAFASFIFFLLLFSGASAGSTSGGMKLVRIVLLMKNGFLEFKRRLHPSAIIPVQLNGDGVAPKIIYNLLAFVFFYLFVFVSGSIALTFIGLDFKDAISASITAVSNVGPGIGSINPGASFAHLPNAAKWVLSFLMILGRLELFTIAILFTPYFWRRN
jgi:trk system potassium uptake protein TrkH